jgi:hypothetical protein
MEEIDWNRYAQLSEEAFIPAIGRFEESLRKAAGMATTQSIPVYAGAMKGSLITAFRQMTEILRKMADSLPEEARAQICQKAVEDRMRELFFERLSRIPDMQIAVDYRCTRILNKTSDYKALYSWVARLRKDDGEIRRIVQETTDACRRFAAQDVPELALMAREGNSLRRKYHE